jgi:omega-6 fatty acid desaturase (delta-12 desaturase)
MTATRQPLQDLPTMAQLNPLLAPYQKSDTRRAVLQLATSVLPYLLLWVAMALSIKVSYWLTVALMPLAAGF